MARENGRAKKGERVRKGEKGGWEGKEGRGGEEKDSRFVPHLKLNPGCATESVLSSGVSISK